jgi:hypothetical protein
MSRQTLAINNLILTNEEFQSGQESRVGIDLPNKFDLSKNALVIEPEVLQEMPPGKAAIIRG